MKLTGGRIESFVRRPDPAIPTVLLYGPDQGLVGERAKRLIAGVIADPADPFLSTDVDGEMLRQHPGRLVEEAQALSLMGGRRAIRLRESAEIAHKAVAQLLELDDQEAFVVIEAGELGPGTPLRKMIERAGNAMAIPCYREEGRGLASSIRSLLEQEKLRLEPDALAYLNEHLGSDHGITRREIEKLATFAGPNTPKLGLEDVASVVGDASALSLDDLIFAVLGRDTEAAAIALDRLFLEGSNPIAVLRPLAKFLMRLYSMAAEIEAGTSLQKVVDQARPPLHFRTKDQVRKALQTWSCREFADAIDRLGQAELLVKRTGSPSQLCCRRIIPDLALAHA